MREGISQPDLHIGQVGSVAILGDDNHYRYQHHHQTGILLDVDMPNSINVHIVSQLDPSLHQNIYYNQIASDLSV